MLTCKGTLDQYERSCSQNTWGQLLRAARHVSKLQTFGGNPEQLTEQYDVGQGAAGSVRQAANFEGKLYAVKELKDDPTDSNDTTEDVYLFIEERNLLQSLHHVCRVCAL